MIFIFIALDFFSFTLDWLFLFVVRFISNSLSLWSPNLRGLTLIDYFPSVAAHLFVVVILYFLLTIDCDYPFQHSCIWVAVTTLYAFSHMFRCRITQWISLCFIDWCAFWVCSSFGLEYQSECSWLFLSQARNTSWLLAHHRAASNCYGMRGCTGTADYSGRDASRELYW